MWKSKNNKNMKITLTHINSKLLELDDKYATLYPKLTELELKYMIKFDKALLTVHSQYGSQELRGSATREMMRLEPEFIPYNTMIAEKQNIEVRMKNLQQISRNLINISWEGQYNG